VLLLVGFGCVVVLSCLFCWRPVGSLHALLCAAILLHRVGSLRHCVGWCLVRWLASVPVPSFSASLVPAGGSSSRLVPFSVPVPVPVPPAVRFSGGGGLPPVVLANFYFCWALPCGGGVWWWCGVVFFPLSFFLPKGGGWGWLGWLFYYQIQKFPVVSFTV
jgi:hypothetical protein